MIMIRACVYRFTPFQINPMRVKGALRPMNRNHTPTQPAKLPPGLGIRLFILQNAIQLSKSKIIR
ncbi:MAG: hypothetical protein DRH11_17185 [Deltaproteobacteria bacterium]|nr:MAG: hypothetical protein DRH11_17185 [Deltaproteobacteria bacterium]